MTTTQATGESELQIGVAAADITPPVGALLVGYLPRRSTAVGHPLRAEALVCRCGGRAWVLVTTDTLGYTREAVAEMRTRVGQRAGLPPQAIMIAATHTHSGPATTLSGGQTNDLDERYLAALGERLAELVARASAAAAPGRFEAAWTAAGELISNRRVQAADGSWTNEWEDPDGRHTGFADPAVLLLTARRSGGGLSSLLVNFGCHPVTLGGGSLDISADYPGYLRDSLEAVLPGCTAQFALAGGANIDPRLACRVGAEYPRNMGESLARTVVQAVPRLELVAPGSLGWAIEPWEMVRTKDAPGALGREVARRGETCRTEVQALVAGRLIVLGLPGELFSEFTPRLRALQPGFTTVVVSLANDFIGYLPTDEAQRQGAYEPTWAPVEELEAMVMDRSAAAIGRALAAASA